MSSEIDEGYITSQQATEKALAKDFFKEALKLVERAAEKCEDADEPCLKECDKCWRYLT